MEKNFKSDTIGERIKKIRHDLGLSLRRMEKDIGLSNSSISRYENGAFDVPQRIQNLICLTYSINPVWLATGEGEMMEHKEEPKEPSLDEIERDFRLQTGFPIPELVLSIVKYYRSLTDHQKQLVEQFIDSLLEENKSGKKTDQSTDNNPPDSEDLSRIA